MTIFEVLAAAMAVVVIAVVITPMVFRRNGQRPNCVNNLKNIGLSFEIFATDNGGAYPFQVSVREGGSREWVPTRQAWRQFVCLSNELSTPKILNCPKDRDRVRATVWSKFDNRSLSYFVNLSARTSNSSMVLSGDRNLTLDAKPVSPGLVMIGPQPNVGWNPKVHKRAGNLILTDRSVLQTTTAQVNCAFQNSNFALPNLLLVP
ncbi:MAG: hypothetical protein JNL10_04130 [Verrucomicrobiales bacterium]|nr:hypothetical protein [Verrucomicrobiales bacterium]